MAKDVNNFVEAGRNGFTQAMPIRGGSMAASVLASALLLTLAGCGGTNIVSISDDFDEGSDSSAVELAANNSLGVNDINAASVEANAEEASATLVANAESNVISNAGQITPPGEPASNTTSQTITDSASPVQLSAASQATSRVAQLYLAQVEGPVGLEISVTAQLHELATLLNEPPILRSQEGLNECEIGSSASQLNAEALDFPVEHLLVSAAEQPFQVLPPAEGDSIDISSPAGSYVMLSPSASEVEGRFTMQSGAPLTSAIPSTLSISVAGAPVQTQWEWQKPNELASSIRDAINSVGTNPDITWEAAEQSDTQQSRIMIYAGHINEQSGSFQSFDCTIEDDGEFTFPDSIQALFESGFTANFIDVVRYTRSLETQEDLSIVNVYVQKL